MFRSFKWAELLFNIAAFYFIQVERLCLGSAGYSVIPLPEPAGQVWSWFHSSSMRLLMWSPRLFLCMWNEPQLPCFEKWSQRGLYSPSNCTGRARLLQVCSTEVFLSQGWGSEGSGEQIPRTHASLPPLPVEPSGVSLGINLGGAWPLSAQCESRDNGSFLFTVQTSLNNSNSI